jgi:hypothetical protein
LHPSLLTKNHAAPERLLALVNAAIHSEPRKKYLTVLPREKTARLMLQLRFQHLVEPLSTKTFQHFLRRLITAAAEIYAKII